MATSRKSLKEPLTTAQLIELAKEKFTEREPPERRRLPMTDYRLAKLLGVRQQVMSNWRHERTGIGREQVAKFAEVTGLPDAYVFACVELEREKDEGVRNVLRAIAKTFGKRAAAVVVGLVAVGSLAAPAPSQAATGPVGSRTGVCILCPIATPGRGRGWRRRRVYRNVIRALA